MAVLFTKKCYAQIISWRKDSNGRVLSLLIKYEDRLLNLVNIYVPVILSERKELLSNLHEFFFPGASLIVDGDFNCYESPLHKYGGNVIFQKEFTDFKLDFHLNDVWRKKHPGIRHFSWFILIPQLRVVWINFWCPRLYLKILPLAKFSQVFFLTMILPR